MWILHLGACCLDCSHFRLCKCSLLFSIIGPWRVCLEWATTVKTTQISNSHKLCLSVNHSWLITTQDKMINQPGACCIDKQSITSQLMGLASPHFGYSKKWSCGCRKTIATSLKWRTCKCLYVSFYLLKFWLHECLWGRQWGNFWQKANFSWDICTLPLFPFKRSIVDGFYTLSLTKWSGYLKQ